VSVGGPAVNRKPSRLGTEIISEVIGGSTCGVRAADHLVAPLREPAPLLVSSGGIWLRHRQPGDRGQRH